MNISDEIFSWPEKANTISKKGKEEQKMPRINIFIVFFSIEFSMNKWFIIRTFPFNVAFYTLESILSRPLFVLIFRRIWLKRFSRKQQRIQNFQIHRSFRLFLDFSTLVTLIFKIHWSLSFVDRCFTKCTWLNMLKMTLACG